LNKDIVDGLLSAVRKWRGLKTADLGLSGDASPVYLNCHLTPLNKRLLREAKSRAKTKEYQYCWVKHCIIYVRKDSKSSAIIVKGLHDLKKII
jgi:orotate phosphoribosyltransferase